MVGGLGLVHHSCVGLITNQYVHKTWVLQHIYIHSTHIYIYIYCKICDWAVKGDTSCTRAQFNKCEEECDWKPSLP